MAYACVLQGMRMGSGVASLATVAQHHGLSVDPELETGPDLIGLALAAERVGFEVRPLKGRFEELAQIPFPAIAQVRAERGEERFVVLHQAGKAGVVLADPLTGVRKLTVAAFEGAWTGYLLVLRPKPVSQVRRG